MSEPNRFRLARTSTPRVFTIQVRKTGALFVNRATLALDPDLTLKGIEGWRSFVENALNAWARDSHGAGGGT